MKTYLFCGVVVNVAPSGRSWALPRAVSAAQASMPWLGVGMRSVFLKVAERFLFCASKKSKKENEKKKGKHRETAK